MIISSSVVNILRNSLHQHEHHVHKHCICRQHYICSSVAEVAVVVVTHAIRSNTNELVSRNITVDAHSKPQIVSQEKSSKTQTQTQAPDC